MKPFYLSFSIAGAVVPYYCFMPWLLSHGLDVRRLFAEVFSTPLGAFFGADVLIGAVVLIAFIRREGERRGVPLVWLPIAATCLVGVSCGLPLFLYLREFGSRDAGRPAGDRP